MKMKKKNKIIKKNNFYIECLSHSYIQIEDVSTLDNYYNNGFHKCNIKDLHINCLNFVRVNLSNVKYLYQLESLSFDDIHHDYIYYFPGKEYGRNKKQELESNTLINITFNNKTRPSDVVGVWKENSNDYLEWMKKCPNIRKLTITNAKYKPLIIETLSSYIGYVYNKQ
jgi:hypothetical protein